VKAWWAKQLLSKDMSRQAILVILSQH